jgi:NADPH-dependent 2,4-dienoyl-CoA reductase/sulfur reductase-like enzyme
MPADAPHDIVHFTFDGRDIAARRGQTVAAALYAAGVTTLTRSVKYRRPRGIHCAAGYCPNCLLSVDGLPHVRSCMTPVSDGLRVESEGSAAARLDPLRAIDRAAPLFPVGFQYRYFKRQGPLWRFWEGQLRKAAAEAEVPEALDVPEAEHVSADLLVVGGGPAGVAAAAAASGSGLSVVIATRRDALGGGLRPALRAGSAPERLTKALAIVAGSPRTKVLAPGTVVAGFGDAYLVDAGTHLVEVTAPTTVLATGAYERALVFPGNDRPGVMLGGAVRRLALEEDVLGGCSVVLVADDDSAYAIAGELVGAGVAVRALLDLRPELYGASAPAAGPDGVEVVRGVESLRARGRARVKQLVFESAGTRRSIDCDIVGMSGGWQPADELRYTATSDGLAVVDGERATPLGGAGNGVPPLAVLQGVGAVVGTWDPEAALAEGWRAGAAAGGGGG